MSLLPLSELEKTIAHSPKIVAPTTYFSEVFALIGQESQDCLLEVRDDTEDLENLLNCVLVAEEDRLIGILTPQDLIRQIDRADSIVRQGMTPAPVTLAKEQLQDLVSLLNPLFQNATDYLPILNNTQEIIGVVTPRTICQHLQTPSFLKQRKVHETMQTEVITASPTASLTEIAQLMVHHAATCVILTAGEKPLGIITASDILQWYGLEVNFTALKAQDGMYLTPSVIATDTSLWEAHRLLQQHCFSHLIVTGESGELQGILTPREILQALQGENLYQTLEQLQQRVEQLEAETRRISTPNVDELFDYTQPIQVLLVNPTQVEAVLIQAMLQYDNDLDLHFQITHVSSLEAALQRLRERTFDVTLLDLSLPDSRGIKTFQQIKQQFPNLAIVILSGVYSNPIPETLEYFRQGAQDFLSKDDYLHSPKFNQKMLVRSLCYAIERRKAELSCQERNAELKQVNRQLNQEIRERQKAEVALQQLTLELEARVKNRTVQLTQTNGILRKEIAIRQQTEEALTQEQSFVSAIFEAAGALIIVLDAEGKIVRFNQACEKITGYGASEVLGKVIWEFLIPPQAGEILQDIFDPQKQISFPYSYGSTLRTKQGDICLIEWSNTALLHENGTANYIISTGIDITERQRSEAERLRLLDLLEASRHEIYIFDAETLQFQYVNQGALVNLGYSLAELQQMTPVDIKPELNEVSFREIIAALYNHEQEIVTFETVHCRANGSRYPVEVHLQLSGQGGKRLCVAMILDISDRKRVESELRKSLRELSNMKYALDRAAIVAITNPQGEITYVNEKFCEVSQYAPEELLGQTHRIINSGYHSRAFFRDLWSTINRGEVWRGEVKNRAKDGSDYWVDTTIVPFLDDNEQVWQHLAIRYNITERKETENALRESEEKFRQIAENVREVFFIHDAQSYEMIYLSPAFAEIWGLSCQEIYENPYLWLESIHPEDRHRIATETQRQLEGVGIHQEFRIFRPDGEMRWIAARSFLVLDESGELDRIVGIAEDVTERKLAEQQLHQLNEDLEIIVAKRTTELSQVNSNLQQEILERQQIESALRLSEERFRATFEQAAVGIAQVGWNGKFLLVNPRLCEILGYSPEELLSKTFNEITYNDDSSQSLEQFNRLKIGQVTAFSLEKRYIRKDGTITWGHVTVSVVGQTATESPYFIAIIEDITQRKKAEESLHLFKTIIESSNEAIAVMDLQGKLLYVNTAYETLFKSSLERVQQLNFRHFLPPHFQEYVDGEVLPILLQQNSWEGELIAIDSEGHDFPIWNRVDSILNEQGEVQYIFALMHDITKEKQAQSALEESEERFRQIAENIREVFWISNPDFTEKIYVSPAYSEIWQRNPEHLYENPQFWLDYVHPDDRQEVQHLFLQSPENFDQEYRIVRPNGSIRWIRDRAFPVRDETGQIYRVAGLAEDITHRKQAEAELLKALAKEKELHQLKSRFVSITSHEFRTPLAVISSSASILQTFGHKLKKEQKQEHYRTIQTYIRHMTKLLDDVLFINQAEVEKLAFIPEDFDIISFCQTLIQEMQLSPGGRLLNFTVTSPLEDAQVYLDKTLLRQILINLLSNAIKYSPDGESIDVSLTLTEESVAFSIQDSGIGIPPEDIPRLFEPFHRGANVGTIQGTGLGLSIVKKGIESHSGTIEVNSQENQGTTFKIILPRQVKVD